MKLPRTELFFFNQVNKDHRDLRLETFGRIAHDSKVPVLVVAREDRLPQWKETFPQGLFAYTRPDAVNLRRNGFPERTAVLLDPYLSRQDLALLRSRAMRDKVNMTQVS